MGQGKLEVQSSNNGVQPYNDQIDTHNLAREPWAQTRACDQGERRQKWKARAGTEMVHDRYARAHYRSHRLGDILSLPERL
jgi:hypothetical protein